MTLRTRDEEEAKPIQVDLKYLCPKDPNRETILEAGGLVLPADGPQHQSGWITKIQNVDDTRVGRGPDGRPFEFKDSHQTAVWKCQTCGSEIPLDPYNK